MSEEFNNIGAIAPLAPVWEPLETEVVPDKRELSRQRKAADQDRKVVERTRRRRIAHLTSVRTWAGIVYLFAGIAVIGGTIVGTGVATWKGTSSDGGDGFADNFAQVNVALGVSIVIGSIAIASVFFMFATWAIAWAEERERTYT